VLVFSGVTPKTIAAQNPEWFAFKASHILKPLLQPFYPLVWMINKLTNTMISILGFDPNKDPDDGLDSEELKSLVDLSGHKLSDSNQGMLKGILDLESVVQDLGLYEPETEIEVEESNSFSGLAMVLDDSSTARKIVKEALKKMGFSVVEAMDGSEGLRKLEDLYENYGDSLSEQLKIIISDVEMPQMDGFHFAAKVKEDERFSKVPIVFNSSISDHFSEDRGIEAGGEAYLVKFQASSFYDEVARVVRAHTK
jgi:CheY-like chemotaxis protein